MIKPQNHIIHRCLWDTTLDQKSKASELQHLISEWSSLHMARDAHDCFVDFKEDVSLSIETLEIDLGIIPFDELKKSLSGRFKSAILQKLQELVFRRSGKGIEIQYKGVASRLEVLRFYLLHGVLPWNESANSSLDDLIDQQLDTNSVHFVDVVRDLGIKENIRRRIAWQFSDEQISKLILVLEPSNHETIWSFSNHVVQSQKKKTMVTSNLSGFRRDVNYWILTHLLVDRGSIFNTTAFIKSTIEQMAQAYYTSYDQLVLMLRGALDETTGSNESKLRFFSILDSLLLKEEGQLAKQHQLRLEELVAIGETEVNEHFQRIHRQLSREEGTRLVESKEFYEYFQLLRFENKYQFLKSLNPSLGVWVEVLISHPSYKDDRSKWDELFELLTSANASSQDLNELGKKLLFKLDHLQVLKHLMVKVHERKSIALEEITFVEEVVLDILKSKSIRSGKLEAFVGKLLSKYANNPSRHDSKVLLHLLVSWIQIDPKAVVQLIDKKDGRSIDLLIKMLPQRSCKSLVSDLDKDGSSGHFGENDDRQALRRMLLEPSGMSSGQLAHAAEAHTYRDLSRYSVGLEKWMVEAGPKQLIPILAHHISEQRIKNIDGRVMDVVFATFLPSLTIGFRQYLDEFLKRFKDSFSMPAGVLEETIMQSVVSCLIDYNYHYGDVSLFDFLVKRTVLARCKNIKVPSKEPEGAAETKSLIEKLKSGDFQDNALNFREYLFSMLERKPSEVREAIRRGVLGKEYPDLLSRNIDYLEFISLLYTDQLTLKGEVVQNVTFLIEFFRSLAPDFFSPEIVAALWKKTLDRVQKDTFNFTFLQKLLEFLLAELAIRHFIPDSKYVGTKIIEESIKIPRKLGEILQRKEILASFLEEDPYPDSAVEAMDSIESIFDFFIETGRLPYEYADVEDDKDGIVALYTASPLQFIRSCRKLGDAMAPASLVEKWDIRSFVKPILRLYPNQKENLSDLVLVCDASKSLKDEIGKEVRVATTQLILEAWASTNWALLSPKVFWAELMKQLSIIGHFPLSRSFKQLSSIAEAMPTRHRLHIHQITKTHDREDLSRDPIVAGRRSIKPTSDLPDPGILIPNAGIVILNSFYKMLFTRLDLLDSDHFKDEGHKLVAVDCLQYVATGSTQCHESDVALNKILTGIPLSFPVKKGIEVSTSKTEIINGMIQAAIKHWQAIGESSVDGFRGNWLVREGMLYEQEEFWNLIVEKRAYDILLNQSPFSFSIIKYPWMPKPLKVEWPY